MSRVTENDLTSKDKAPSQTDKDLARVVGANLILAAESGSADELIIDMIIAFESLASRLLADNLHHMIEARYPRPIAERAALMPVPLNDLPF